MLSYCLVTRSLYSKVKSHQIHHELLVQLMFNNEITIKRHLLTGFIYLLTQSHKNTHIKSKLNNIQIKMFNTKGKKNKVFEGRKI